MFDPDDEAEDILESSDCLEDALDELLELGDEQDELGDEA